MPTPFNELELSTYEHLLLIRIKFTGISKESVRIKPRCKYLYKFGLIDNSTKNINKYVISDKGKCTSDTNAVIHFVFGYLSLSRFLLC